MTSQQKVTPFEASNVTDYDRLVRDFGCEVMTGELIARFEALTGVVFPLAYRNFVISHRDFTKILDSYEKKEPFYLYTGRGPSSERMHLGHLVPFRFCKFLQDAFGGIPVVIQITNDDKVIKRKTLQMSHTFGNLFTYEDCDGDRHEKQFSSCTLLKDLGHHKIGEKIDSILIDNFSACLTISGETDDGNEIYEAYEPHYTLLK